jgi:hypothetical protein
MTYSFLVCEQCPSSTKIKGSSFVSFVCLMKWRNHWKKSRSVSTHPEGWQAWIDPGGLPFISSCFIFFLGNISNGGMKCPFGLIQVTTDTRDLRSVDWREDIWSLPFNPIIFVCLCCTIVTPVSSQLSSLVGLCWMVSLRVRIFQKQGYWFRRETHRPLRVKDL